jgi:hypothetical protein
MRPLENTSRERRLATLYIEAAGLRIEYGLGDRDGRWMQTIGTEFAPWNMTPAHLGGFRRWLVVPAAAGDVGRCTTARPTYAAATAEQTAEPAGGAAFFAGTDARSGEGSNVPYFT